MKCGNLSDDARSSVHRSGGFETDRFRSSTTDMRILSVVCDHGVRQTSNRHEGDGPKLPHQAVVIRQSAKHQKAEMPSCRKALWTLTRVQDRSPFSVVFLESSFRKRASTAGNTSAMELQPPLRTGSSKARATVAAS